MSISSLSVPAGLLLGASIAMWTLFLERLALVAAGKKDSASIHAQLAVLLTLAMIWAVCP